jgi:exosortase/archaeosortase family protein
VKNIFQSEIVHFFLKIAGFFLVWYILYDLWIMPNGWIDEPLSRNIAGITAGLLTASGETVFLYDRVVGIFGSAGVEIVDGCNGISAIGLFLAFIIAFPGSRLPRFLFSILGITVIYLSNIVRVTVLAYTQAYWPAGFAFTHDYSTTTLFYLIIFVLWVIWANTGTQWMSGSEKLQEQT